MFAIRNIQLADAGGVVLTVIGNVANKLRISMGFMDFIICDQETRGIIIWLGLESDWVKNRQETAIKMGNMTPAGWRLGYFEFLVEVGPTSYLENPKSWIDPIPQNVSRGGLYNII